MRTQSIVMLMVVAVLSAGTHLALPATLHAESPQMKEDVDRLAADLHTGVERSTLTDNQKAQLRDDFRELKEARKNHQTFAALRAARSIKATLDSGAFKPEDQQRIKQDMEAIKEARENQ